ncbi:MAG: exopolyphosphatase [Rhizobiales bacterium 65-9]|nr:exopolyphosphatase [Hyphomicrobiales bacterium]OJY35420.1 MAG: exopolyphosphatase [Rhizobiales bacterium 65-9]
MAKTPGAQGRLDVGDPVAIVDIGSNSVRLVAYEGLTRAPTPIFNEKTMCGLGRGVQITGRLNEQAMDKALAALARFRVLCDMMRIERRYVLATAAARDAANGPDFIQRAEKAFGRPIELLSGKREAHLAALGVASGFYKANGIVGDLGGGSLELTEVRGHKIGKGKTTPLGGLALQDASHDSIKEARRIVRRALADVDALDEGKGRSFYMVGGTWRSLTTLHIHQLGYPLHVSHGYVMSAADAVDFAELVQRVDPETLDSIEKVSSQRRPLLAYGALVLEEVVRRAKPSQVVMSAMGVREGLLFELLDEETRERDPLLSAARELNTLRSRAPLHGEDLIRWTDHFMRSSRLEETPEEKRLRHAACLLADIGWRAHPDYRGEQSLNVIAHAAFIGIDHPGRAYIAMSIFYRHAGLDDELSPRIRELCSARMIDRARILGALMRVAYLVSAGMPDILERTPLACDGGRILLDLPPDISGLANERLFNRLKQLARLIGRAPALRTDQGAGRSAVTDSALLSS